MINDDTKEKLLDLRVEYAKKHGIPYTPDPDAPEPKGLAHLLQTAAKRHFCKHEKVRTKMDNRWGRCERCDKQIW